MAEDRWHGGTAVQLLVVKMKVRNKGTQSQRLSKRAHRRAVELGHLKKLVAQFFSKSKYYRIKQK